MDPDLLFPVHHARKFRAMLGAAMFSALKDPANKNDSNQESQMGAIRRELALMGHAFLSANSNEQRNIGLVSALESALSHDWKLLLNALVFRGDDGPDMTDAEKRECEAAYKDYLGQLSNLMGKEDRTSQEGDVLDYLVFIVNNGIPSKQYMLSAEHTLNKIKKQIPRSERNNKSPMFRDYIKAKRMLVSVQSSIESAYNEENKYGDIPSSSPHVAGKSLVKNLITRVDDILASFTAKEVVLSTEALKNDLLEITRSRQSFDFIQRSDQSKLKALFEKLALMSVTVTNGQGMQVPGAIRKGYQVFMRAYLRLRNKREHYKAEMSKGGIKKEKFAAKDRVRSRLSSVLLGLLKKESQDNIESFIAATQPLKKVVNAVLESDDYAPSTKGAGISVLKAVIKDLANQTKQIKVVSSSMFKVAKPSLSSSENKEVSEPSIK